MRRIVVLVLLASVCFVQWNCAEQQARPNYAPYCNIFLSRTKGMVNKHFSSQITYSSNFVQNPEYSIGGSLPPGLRLDASRGIIEGVPPEAGFWQVNVRVRDRDRGTHDQPAGQNWSYYCNVEIKIFDKLTDEN